MELIQQFITCKKCDILRGEIKEKEKNFEEDLAINQDLVKERDEENNRLYLRIEALEKRNESFKYKSKQC